MHVICNKKKLLQNNLFAFVTEEKKCYQIMLHFVTNFFYRKKIYCHEKYLEDQNFLPLL